MGKRVGYIKIALVRSQQPAEIIPPLVPKLLRHYPIFSRHLSYISSSFFIFWLLYDIPRGISS